MKQRDIDPAIRKRQAQRERQWQFGEDASSMLDGDAANLLEQAQEVQAAQTSLAADPSLGSQSASDRYNEALADRIAMKQEQAERLEERLEQLIDRQTHQIQHTMSHRPGRMSLPATKARWQVMQYQQVASMQRLQSRLQMVREVKDAITISGSRIEGIARNKVKHENPTLVAERDEEARRARETLSAHRRAARDEQTLKLQRNVVQATVSKGMKQTLQHVIDR